MLVCGPYVLLMLTSLALCYQELFSVTEEVYHAEIARKQCGFSK